MDAKENHKVFQQVENDYWNYYRELETELLSIRKYVDFNKDNFKTYSIEFLKLFQTVCSEIDVVGRSMASLVEPRFKPNDKGNNLFKWWYEIQDTFTSTGQAQIAYGRNKAQNVKLTESSFSFCNSYEMIPWKNFRVEKYVDSKGAMRYRLCDACKTPKWWSDYNKVKHSRMSLISNDKEKHNFSRANLENVCHAFAALYSLEKALMEMVGTQDDLESFFNQSQVFTKLRFVTSKDIEDMFNDCV